MKLIIIICAALCILFIILALVFARKKQPGLDIATVNNQQCNIYDTVLCDTTDECNKKCADGVGSKCYHLYYQNYIYPGASPSTPITPTSDIYKMYNTQKGTTRLHYTSYNDIAKAPSAYPMCVPTARSPICVSTPTVTNIFRPTTFLGDTIGQTNYEFPEIMKQFAEKIDTDFPKDLTPADTVHLIPPIDTQKDTLPTCMHTNQVCAYWQYFSQPYEQYTLCGGDPGQDPNSPSCDASRYSWKNYFAKDNLIAQSGVEGDTNIVQMCNLNANCQGYLEPRDGKPTIFIGKPTVSGVYFNDFNNSFSNEKTVCLPSADSPSTTTTPPDYCPPPSNISPTALSSVCSPTTCPTYRITPTSTSGTSSKVIDNGNSLCGYKVTSIKSPTKSFTITQPKTCAPASIDLTTVENDYNQLWRKTCSYYDSEDFQLYNQHYFSPAYTTTTSRMYNMQQNCNNQTHCIWRDILTDGNWQESDFIKVAPSVCPTQSDCSQFKKIKFVYDQLKPSQRLIYKAEKGSGSGSSSGTGVDTSSKEFCYDDPKEALCQHLLGIDPVTELDDNLKYSYKIINFGCADMVGDINNKVESTIVNPDNNYLYYKNMLCDYKLKCLQLQKRAKAPRNRNDTIPPYISPATSCDSPAATAAIPTCQYRDKIIQIAQKVSQEGSDLPQYQATPYNKKSGVCLEPPNTIMSDNPCNLFTSESIVTQHMFNSDSVCQAFTPTECNTDEFCTTTFGGCRGYCETAPSLNTEAKCDAEPACKWDGFTLSPTKCKSVKNKWECRCLNNEYIQNLFEEDNNRCDKIQPTVEIPVVNYYKDESPSGKTYMQYANNCCHFDNKSPSSTISPTQLKSTQVFSSDLISDVYRQKCDENKCTTGDKLFGRLVIPNCSIIEPSLCEPNNVGGQANTLVDSTWPCMIKKINDEPVCVNKPGRDPGSDWETDCYTEGGDGQKIFSYDTCWNPLYGVLSPCGIDYTNNAYAGDLNRYFNKKCVLDNCCGQDYTGGTPVDVQMDMLSNYSRDDS